ncbi:MAG: hypothetical protein ACXU82_14450 [Caulobacteraceae bacterium]
MPQSYIPYLVMAVALIFMIRRNLRSRVIRADTLWVFPLILLVIAALTLALNPPRDALGVGALVLCALVGAVAGWYRGKFTHITLDADTGVLTGKGSVVGLVLILALYVGRQAVVTWARSHPDHSGTAVLAADCALVLGFATLIVSRLEMWLRCRTLMAGTASAT